MKSRDSRTSDDEIVQRVRQGDVDAFEVLVRRYQDHVFNLVKRHVPPGDVEETAQEAMIRAYKSLSGYRGEGGGFRSWMSAVAVRACYDYWRRAYRSKEVPISALSDSHKRWIDQVTAETSVQILREKTDSEDAHEVLNLALGRLSAEDRMVLELVYFEGYSGRESAELLGWTPANVKVRTFRARRKLEKILLAMIKEQP